ncbi:hypothetical protein ACVWWR_001214 [Bradyrhizobium sp. LM3.2]
MRDLEWLEVASGCLVACLIHDDVGHTGTRPKLNRPTLVVLLMSRVSLRSAASRRCGMRSITISAIVEIAGVLRAPRPLDRAIDRRVPHRGAHEIGGSVELCLASFAVRLRLSPQQCLHDLADVGFSVQVNNLV